jgi:hypothetical protein
LFSQPNGVSFTDDRTPQLQRLRADVLAGVVDMAKLERRVRLLTSNAPLCPSCGTWPQEGQTTGLCTPCQFRYLAEARRFEAEVADARRELDRERQAKHRRIKRAAALA